MNCLPRPICLLAAVGVLLMVTAPSVDAFSCHVCGDGQFGNVCTEQRKPESKTCLPFFDACHIERQKSKNGADKVIRKCALKKGDFTSCTRVGNTASCDCITEDCNAGTVEEVFAKYS